MNAPTQFYVYKLISSLDRNPFYVGKGKGDRMFAHERDRNKVGNTTHSNKLIKNKINKIIAEGGTIIYHSRHVASEIVAFELERRLILKYGRRDNQTGILCNMTAGGEGVSGHIRSSSWKEKHRVAAHSRCRKIDQYSHDGSFIKTWDNYKQIICELAIDTPELSRSCNGKIKSAGGFRWTWNGDPLHTWVAHSLRSSHIPHRQRTGKTVHQYTQEGNFIAEYESLKLAAKAVGKHASGILACCKGQSATAAGYVFVYAPNIFLGYDRTLYRYDNIGNYVDSWVSVASASLRLGVSATSIHSAAKVDHVYGNTWYWSYQKCSSIALRLKTRKTVRVVQLSLSGNIISSFSSVRLAIQTTKIKGVANCITGRAKTAGGFVWKIDTAVSI